MDGPTIADTGIAARCWSDHRSVSTFLAVGESKAQALAAAFGPEARPDPAIPSSLVAAEADLVSVILDDAAAAALSTGARA